MVYGITIVEHDKSMPVNRNGAISFVKFVLSENGQKIMAENGQPPIIPPKISGNQSILK
jgi:molybdate/tungstate transport system substrate-binding protein